VYAPLSTLTETAFSRLNLKDSVSNNKSSQASQQGRLVDYGTTYMLEEYWLPRLEMSATVGLPPIETIFACSEAADAAAIAAAKVRMQDVLCFW
jgi:hypothetical protein